MTYIMDDIRHHINPAAGQMPIEPEVKRLAIAGEMRLAVSMYRAIHDVGVKEAIDAINKLAGLPQAPEQIGSVVLSQATQRRLEILFRPEDRAEASRLLVEKCGDNLPDHERSTAQSLERTRFAALKVSEGDLSRLRDAIQLANEDWRDLLSAAEFWRDTRAHERWFPKAS
jgi:hypothetical protein